MNHLFSALTGERRVADLLRPLGRLPLVEALNGAMPRAHNAAGRLSSGRAAGMALVGGSDAHSLAHVARAFTEVRAPARARSSSTGCARADSAGGPLGQLPPPHDGGHPHLRRRLRRDGRATWCERSATHLRVAAIALLLPFLPLIPLFTLAIHAHEIVFAAQQFRALVRYGSAAAGTARRVRDGAGGGRMSVIAYVIASDDRLFGQLCTWRPPRWVRLWMLWATRLGDGWLWLLTPRCCWPAAATAALQVLSAGLVAAGLSNALLILAKRRVHRARPCERRKPVSFDVDPLAWFPSDRFSFPSGHALNSFAVGSVLALAFPVIALPGARGRRERRGVARRPRSPLAERRPRGRPPRRADRNGRVAGLAAVAGAPRAVAATLAPQPFTTTIGSSRATRRARPALSVTSTTSSTSL